MQAAGILGFVQRRPFRPFRITLTDGRAYEIHHPELAMVGRSTVVIGIKTSTPSEIETELGPMYDRVIHVDLLHIMEAEPIQKPAAPASS